MNAPVFFEKSRTGTSDGAKVKRWHHTKVALVERLLESGKTYGQIACAIGVPAVEIERMVTGKEPESPLTTVAKLRWRLKQIITAGFDAEEASDLIGAPLTLARSVFDEVHGEVK